MPSKKSQVLTAHAPYAKLVMANGKSGDSLDSITIPAPPRTSAWSNAVSSGDSRIFRCTHSRAQNLRWRGGGKRRRASRGVSVGAARRWCGDARTARRH